jgi:threonine dehydrogenase-like Zn-dependent dehydrogenase
MRAALLRGFGDLVVAEVPDPRPAPGDVVVRVSCVQPSVTECALIAGEPVALHARLAAALADGEPVQFGGHEFCGTVIGGTTGFASGDRVTAVETIPCGWCAACRRGRADACVKPEFLGYTRPGAFAELVAVPAASLVRVPDSVSDSAAAAISRAPCTRTPRRRYARERASSSSALA